LDRSCAAVARSGITRTFEPSGSVTPVIDREYPFEQLPAAAKYQEEGHAPGKVVVTV
jgi:NADPH:quinone reductase-like Zn-dependent oxidoreductase